jgi:DNA polymerase-3 subunit alpha
MVEALIRCGAFDSLGAARPQLIQILPRAIELASVYQREHKAPQVSLFDLLSDIPTENSFAELTLPEVEDWSDREKLQCEKECLGFYVSGHPLDKYLIDFQSFSTVTSGTLPKIRRNAQIRILGIVTKLSTKLDKRGNVMAFAQLEDYEGSIELIVFHEAYEKYKSLLSPDSIIWVEGNLGAGGEKKITVRRVTSVEQMRERLAKFVNIVLPLDSATEENLKRLKGILAKQKGRCRLRVAVSRSGLGRINVLTGKSFSLEPSNELVERIQALEFQKILTFSEN